jgi:hypothetical protein
MTTYLRAVKAALIIGIVLVGSLFATIYMSPSTTIASAKLLTYDAALQLSYDIDAVNNAKFQPDGPPVLIPLTIQYRVFVPSTFLSSPILRIIFLQTFIIINAQISLTVVNQPTWAAVSITPSNPYVNISNSIETASAVLAIAPHANAPAEGFSLNIHASVPALLNNHVAAKEADLTVIFQPGYIPLINIDVDNPSRIVSPQQTTTFRIAITNMGNKQTLVTGKIVNAPEGWAALLSNNQILIDSSESGLSNVQYISFSVTPPYGLGYHDDLGQIILEFTPQFFPLPPQGNAANYTGAPVQVPLIVRSRGFSTPGFEIVGFILALVIVIAIVMKKQKNKQI